MASSKIERSEVIVATLVCAVTFATGVCVSSTVRRSNENTSWQVRQMQSLSLLRSEVRRGVAVVQALPQASGQIALPMRHIEMEHLGAPVAYNAHTQLQCGRNVGGDEYASVRSQVNSGDDRDLVDDYVGYTLRRPAMSKFGFLIDTNLTQNDDLCRFYGWDEIYGRVHSNTDIWCSLGGGSWPLFHDRVSTTGLIQYVGGTPDPNEIFLDGYIENAQMVVFDDPMFNIHQVAQPVWSEYDIAFVTLDGWEYFAYLGLVQNCATDAFVVYDMYPPFAPVGDSIGVNSISLKDTLWIAASGVISAQGVLLSDAGELWIMGECAGPQTWASESDIKITGDLCYAHTPIGERADGLHGGPVNMVDYLGLVANGDILVQYGYCDPATGDRCKPNCNGEVYIYGAMAALKDGEGDPHEDGVFSFEYHYPHQSTPNYLYEGEYYDYVDLHLCQWPPQEWPHYWPWPAKGGGGYSYAGLNDQNGPDYPWYNPLWPEWIPTLERGEIHIYGSVAQRRRGYMHRSGSDPLDTGWWDPENHMYGPAGVYGVNAAGVTGSGIGYRRTVHYDYRLEDLAPPAFPALRTATAVDWAVASPMRFSSSGNVGDF